MMAPADGAHGVNPTATIRVFARDGTLSAVTLTGPDGERIRGKIATHKTTWASTGQLDYGKAYVVTAVALNAKGKPTRKRTTFATVQPANMTLPSMQWKDGATYGVGQVASVHFDEAIKDRPAAERALSVQTIPPVQGSWYWMDEQNIHWRPQTYFNPGTTVRVSAKVVGLQLGPDLWGQQNVSASYKIGQSHLSIADDKTKQVTVYVNGKRVRTMPTSMGRGGSQFVAGRSITFWTPTGTATVIDKSNPVLMDSSTFGLPINSPLGYKLNVYWATKITGDGVFLHSAPWSVWAQGNTDTSHGCLNLSPANAEWFYKLSVPGDVVQIKNTGGAPLEVWQNGDWTLPWAQWQAGSALKS
jgi:lipoprotein-anchoring transpeptidase ErfK/SrfK